MGIFDIFGRKRKGRPSQKEGGKGPKVTTLRPGKEKEAAGSPAEPSVEEMEAALKVERARSIEQEKRLKQMEESISRMQGHWKDLMDKQQKAFESMMAERSRSGTASAGPHAPKEPPVGAENASAGTASSGKGGAQPTEDGKALRIQTTDADGVVDRLSSPILKEKTFPNFVVDDSNRFPFLAAEAVASCNTRRYNPLFIFGPVGVGKTHLLQAIANRMMEKEPGLRVLYTSTEKLTDELIRVLDTGDLSGFRKHYEEMDVLLIDDIQMLSGKQRTQTEFFHMFNHLYNSQKQIVLCSDRPPSDIEELETRLRSRFEGGLIIDIKVPTFEGRKQILVNLAQREGFSISVEVLDYLAFYLDSSVRELEGGFNRVTAFASLMKEPITVNLVMKVLDSIIRDKDHGFKERQRTPQPKVDFVREDDARRAGPPDLDLEEEADRLEKELLQEIRKSTGATQRHAPRTS